MKCVIFKKSNISEPLGNMLVLSMFIYCRACAIRLCDVGKLLGFAKKFIHQMYGDNNNEQNDNNKISILLFHARSAPILWILRYIAMVMIKHHLNGMIEELEEKNSKYQTKNCLQCSIIHRKTY